MALIALSTLGLLVIDAIPTVIGVAEAIDAQKKQNQQAKERIKFNLTANFSVDGKSPVQTATVVFKNNKVIPPCPVFHHNLYHLSDIFFSPPIHITQARTHFNCRVALSRPPRTSGLRLQVQRFLFSLPVRGEAPGYGFHGLG